MPSLLRSKIFLKLFGGIVTVVALFSASLLIFSVPAIDRRIFAIEAGSARTILDNVLDLAQQGHNNLTLYRRTAHTAHRQELRTVLDLAESMVKMQWARVGRGEVPAATARREILETVRRFKFRRNDYVWISDYNSVLISHPDPALHGADYSQVKDIHGQLIVPPMVQSARLGGDGYHSYWWRRLNETEPVEKLAYFRHLPEMAWVIGTGVYVDDIEQQVAEHREQLIEELRAMLGKIKLAETGYVYIFDSGFNMLIHPNPNIEKTNFSAQLNPADGQPLAPQLIAAAGRKEGWRYLWDRPDAPGNYRHEKISWVHYLPELDWYIGSSVYVEELKRSSAALKQRIILITLAVLLLAALGAWLFSRRLTAPLRELSRLADRVRVGDFSKRGPLAGDDEIGILSRTFNQMLDQIQDNIKNLDAKVAGRTAELSRALDELRQLEAMKSAFLTNISHEMRTPLTSIHGFAELTRRKFEKSILPLLAAAGDPKSGKTGDQIRQNLAIIAAESEQLSALIENALDLAALEEGKAEWEEETLPLREVIELTATAMGGAAAAKGLSLRLEIPDELPEIRGDRERLGQALGNLLDNALKFSQEGEIVCRVVLDSKKATISISDSGIGIAAADQEKIFDKFKQAGDILTGKPPGYGLGLAISKRIIEHHGGAIWVASEPGRGSTFSFSLPRTPPTAPGR